MFERLAPAGGAVSAADVLAEAGFAALAPEQRPYTFFNFVSTLDGRAALDGSTRPLGGPADLEMLLALRTVADAVLIGPGTVRAEGYGRLVSPDAAPGPAPAGGADLAPLRHPVGGGAVRRGRPAGDRLHVGRRRATRRRWPRRSRSSASRRARPRPRWRTCAPAASARC